MATGLLSGELSGVLLVRAFGKAASTRRASPALLAQSAAGPDEFTLAMHKAWTLLCRACSFLAGSPAAVSATEMDRFRVTFTLHVAFCVFGQL
eukprot:5260963-Pleurochrysis_carterae.AAC.1